MLCAGRLPVRRQQLQASPAAEHSRGAFPVGRRLRKAAELSVVGGMPVRQLLRSGQGARRLPGASAPSPRDPHAAHALEVDSRTAEKSNARRFAK